MSKSSDGSPSQPKLTVSNINSLISSLCLKFEDMLQAKVTIFETFAHYLDAKNFTDGNLTANHDECFKQVFYIDTKTSEIAGEIVEFELSSPFDLQGLRIPIRQIHTICTWCMRGWYRTGNGCGYSGTKYFDKDGKPIDDLAKDECGGLLLDCKKRFGENNPLDFGGLPASGLVSR
ncbi:phage minor tail protein L [Photorhabdus khanii subsp. guanajuatensis]|uniref:Phage minor tail protein L n=1 Tax=Photorhabdus khanii subsp. guanajuatensis TaxID=2100166 RepID=A0A4R4ITF0_9GAMM|nr:phage minor tail protein L [Photorhabdus khanii subsp. guanajuatensis]